MSDNRGRTVGTSEMLEQAIAAVKAGDKSTGRQLLAQVLQANPRNEAAWLWLAYAVDDVAQKRECLERVLKLNPANRAAKRRLESISRKRTKRRLGLLAGILAIVGAVAVCAVLAGAWRAGWLTPVEPGSTEPTWSATQSTTGKWRTTFGTSPFDDSKTVVLKLEAEKAVEGWLRSYTPVLVLRCQEDEIEAYIVLGMQTDVEYGMLDSATVRIRFDKEQAQRQVMSQSTDGEALFFEDHISMIATMMRHDEMTFGFTPFNAPPTETTFDLRGLQEAIIPLQRACRWR